MPIYQTIQNMLQTQAQTEDIQQQTQQRIQQILMNKKQMEAFDRSQAADEAYRQDQIKMATMGDPAANDLTTKSVGATEDGSSSMYDKSLKSLQSQQKMATTNIQLAQKYGKDPKPYLTALENANTQMRELAKDATKDQAEKAQQTAQILRDVNSPAGLGAALEHIASAFGEKKAQDVASKLPHDADGNLVWNEKAKAALAPFAAQYTTMHESGIQAHNAASLDHQVRADEERARNDKANNVLKAQEIAVRREGISHADSRHKDTIDAMGGKETYKVTKDDQNAIYKLSNTYKIVDYQKGNEVASGVESKLLDPKQGYEAISAPNARTLVEQGKLMMDNYRARTGGKYTDQQVGRMNSLLGRAEKYIDTIGEGDKLLAKDVMLQLSREMKTMYADRNVDLLKDELSIASKTNRKGGDAGVLTLKGNLDSAVEAGRAKKVTYNGKDYVAFGKKPEDIYEIPSSPERSKFFVVPSGE